MGDVVKCTQAPCESGKPAVGGLLQFCPEDKRGLLPATLRKLLTF
jgi:hypothetical protein